MKNYYAKNYIDGMKLAGYTVSNFMTDMFCSCFSECEGNEEYRVIIQKNGNDFQKFCAAYAQLKTNRTLGCSNDAPYDITSSLHLSKDEFNLFVEILPHNLASLAKGACNLIH